ncbi:hypothetical protein LJC16_02520 [Bacteroidales bacterium OttesenSCG-928-C19]|nr:hypothetical protein [Bacteroidales bacterium OttesenSCG-928-C19]
MKKLFYSIIFILTVSVITFFSCGKFEIWVDLGGSFNYLNKGAYSEFTRFSGDGIFYKGIPSVFPTIKNYKYEERYITIKQQYNKKLSSSLLETILVLDSYYGAGYFGEMDTAIFPVYNEELKNSFHFYYKIHENTYRSEFFSDSVVNIHPYFKEMEKNKFNYYIINKDNQVKIGPLSKDEFKKEFTELNLPSILWIE